MSEKSNCLLAESHLKTHMDASFYPVVKNLRSVADELDDVRKEIKKQESNHKFDRLERFMENALDSVVEDVSANLTKGFSSTQHKLHHLKDLTEEVGVNITQVETDVNNCCVMTQSSIEGLQNSINSLAEQLNTLQGTVNTISSILAS